MNDNAKKWAEDLRSGDHEQCQGYLSIDGGYCCLGRACEIYQQEVGDLVISHDEGCVEYDGDMNYLPSKVKEWLGLSSNAGCYIRSSLSCRNDDGKTFSEIADIIESEPEGLFVE